MAALQPRRLCLYREELNLRLQNAISNIYLELTNRFNEEKLRAVLSSDQDALIHGIAWISGMNGDWIVREDEESLEYILGVLEDCGASYRLGAPLDARWMSGGWSAHFEFDFNGSRTRTDFVTRPPRLSAESLAQMWDEQKATSEFPVPTIDLERLARLKLTQRERDYAFIGEIARKLNSVRQQMLWSRSTRDLIRLADEYPQMPEQLAPERPLLSQIQQGRRTLEAALDFERRELSIVNEDGLEKYALAAQEWTRNWPKLKALVIGLPLKSAHKVIVEHARVLPQQTF